MTIKRIISTRKSRITGNSINAPNHATMGSFVIRHEQAFHLPFPGEIPGFLDPGKCEDHRKVNMDVAAFEGLIIGQLEFQPNDHLVVFSIQRDQGEGILHCGRGDERVENVKSM
jgi:hypothetical protein